MNKIVSIIITLALITGLGIILIGSNKESSGSASVKKIENVEMKDGIQYVTINAKGGYSPKVSNATADIPTKLIVKTKGTFDCSISLVIHSVGFKKILNQTGEEIIDIGSPKAGESLQGLCGMGMYSFLINFS